MLVVGVDRTTRVAPHFPEIGMPRATALSKAAPPRTIGRGAQSWIVAVRSAALAALPASGGYSPTTRAAMEPESCHEQNVAVSRRAGACLGSPPRTVRLATGDCGRDGALSDGEGSGSVGLARADSADARNAFQTFVGAKQIGTVLPLRMDLAPGGRSYRDRGGPAIHGTLV